MFIFVDGCCNKIIGSCSSIVDSEGVDLIEKYSEFIESYDFISWFDLKIANGKKVIDVSFSDVKTQQNNGAELVACVVGLCIAIHFGYSKVFSDSKLIVDHWSKKESKTIKDPRKSKLQRFLIKLRSEFENLGGSLEWISGDNNISDLGFHKVKR